LADLKSKAGFILEKSLTPSAARAVIKDRGNPNEEQHSFCSSFFFFTMF
jgi:hypothetical protein